MARIKLPSYMNEANGRMRDAVIYKRRGTMCMRPYVVPRNPDTPAQRQVRNGFREAVHAWQALSMAERQVWNRRARYGSRSGYNLFMSQHMKGSCHGVAVPCSSMADDIVTPPIVLRSRTVPEGIAPRWMSNGVIMSPQGSPGCYQ